MKDLNTLNQYRIKIPGFWVGDSREGAFAIQFRGSALRVIASSIYDWDHVSVSLKHRNPNWDEMCHIQGLFFEPTETCMQLHVPKDEWISNHPYCLHIWRPHKLEIPRPPGVMVGIKEVGDVTGMPRAERERLAEVSTQQFLAELGPDRG